MGRGHVKENWTRIRGSGLMSKKKSRFTIVTTQLSDEPVKEHFFGDGYKSGGRNWQAEVTDNSGEWFHKTWMTGPTEANVLKQAHSWIEEVKSQPE